jgi:dTDP-4-amino-4,6-dideoxygalactose transaminase
LKHLPGWLQKRIRNAHLYNELLKETDLMTPVEVSDVKAVYHLYVVRTRKELRHKLQNYLRSKGIATGIHYPIALPNLKAYSRLKHTENDFPEATKASQEVLSLPMFAELEEEEIAYIAQEIRNFQGEGS